MSVIGSQPALAIPARTEPSAPQAAFLPAVAQGLVSFDAAGQIEAGLAERWNVSDDGMSYIFRLRDAAWADGRPVTANDVVAGLRAAMSDGGNNRLAMLLGAVDKIVAVTPQVIEIRLKAPRPLLLPLLAQPELGLIRRAQGSGPYRILSSKDGVIALEALIPKDAAEDPQVHYPVQMRSERAALALIRFKRGTSASVLGGTFADLPIARAANLPPAQLRFDPAQGLFGLAVTAKSGFLGRADNRNAVAMAIDRDAIAALSGVRDWRPVLSLLPKKLDMAGDPALPDWIRLGRDVRLALASARVNAWIASYDEVPPLRIALPDGPGSRMLFARLASDLRAIGLQAVRVGAKEAADLRLIDSVSPSDSATWYLRRINCAAGLPCDKAAEKALEEARDTLSLPERALKLKEADAAFIVHMPFIPIAAPLRWSAVSPRLTGFQPNARAVHPLGRLLKE
ncbi:ABC transporter substrate-binding protein [Sphingobium boeckii]|uniref:Peptide/nickel transport system substrate-binding protein n=1 Tax=Sphingobium boeckii TaxID=1082345 RepID=A0A7W9AHM4_9SPHN|nr:peptide/nickel transport system substrate-binding protein [Sphingobium boeckii]